MARRTRSSFDLRLPLLAALWIAACGGRSGLYGDLVAEEGDDGTGADGGSSTGGRGQGGSTSVGGSSPGTGGDGVGASGNAPGAGGNGSGATGSGATANAPGSGGDGSGAFGNAPGAGGDGIGATGNAPGAGGAGGSEPAGGTSNAVGGGETGGASAQGGTGGSGARGGTGGSGAQGGAGTGGDAGMGNMPGVPCGGVTCGGGDICCVGLTDTTCLPPGGGCNGAELKCSAPSGCAEDQFCCLTMGGGVATAECTDECSNGGDTTRFRLRLCESDADCTPSRECRLTFIAVNACMRRP